MKNWSLKTILLVAGGSFIGVLVLAFVVINFVAKPVNNAGSSSPRRSASVIEKTEVAQQQMIGPDIVSVQLESAQVALREAREETQSLEKKLQASLIQRDAVLAQQMHAFNEHLQNLHKRISALEEDQMMEPSVAVVKPEWNSAQQTGGQTTTAKDRYVPPKGFTVRAELGDRVWISDGKREFSVLKTQQPPKAVTHIPDTTSIDKAKAPVVTASTKKLKP